MKPHRLSESNVCRQQLNLESTLQDLPLHDFQVETHCYGMAIARNFAVNPLIPGVILTLRGQFAGMISRRQFMESMSLPYGQQVFSKRPIECLYRLLPTETLTLTGDTKIVAAARQSLQRTAELVYEPIVVEIAPQIYRLLDVHQLLVAQSQIHELATGLLTQLYQQLEKTNHDLQRQVCLDGLTQVSNRRHFDEYLDKEWRRAAREQVPISLILCDVDFFKLYNDTYGHLAGDDCLRQVACAIKAAVRRGADLVARYGGEEFTIVLPSTEAVGAACVAAEISSNLKAMAIAHANSSVSRFVTISAGVATLVPHPEATPESLIAAADKALYQAKAAGRDRLHHTTPQLPHHQGAKTPSSINF